MAQTRSLVALGVIFLEAVIIYWALYRCCCLKPSYRTLTNRIQGLDIKTGHSNENKTGHSNENKTKDDGVKMACNFPSLDPWNPALRHLLSPPPKPKCPLEDLMFKLDPKTSQLVKHPNASKNPPVWTNCCYKVVFRLKYNKEFGTKCFPILNETTSISPQHEFLTVYCDHVKDPKRKSKMIQVLAHTPLKPEVEARVKRINNKSSSSSSPRDRDTVNLLIHVWDSLSEMELQRSGPKLRQFLIKDLSAFTFKGYTKVGVNSPPNGIPLLTGLHRDELEASGCIKAGYYDECPSIYQNYAKKGYRTSAAYDVSDWWIYSFLNGFKRPPTDYYLRPLARVAEAHIAHDRRGCWFCNICWGPQLALEVLLDYMRAMASTMGRDKRYLQLTWSNALTHDILLAGSLGEDILLTFLKWMQAEGHFNRTIFVFMSDHGMCRGEVRNTPQGKLEANMPFLYFVVPEWIRKKYPLAMRNLKLNSDRLSTHFDTHATFNDILDLTRIEDEALRKRAKALQKSSKAKLPRGISLFLPIPKRRTCEDASIAKSWCVCDARKSLSTNSTEAIQGARTIVSHLNKFISNQAEGGKKCANLTLKSVHNAQVVLDGDEDPKNSFQSNSTDVYEVGLVTSPGDASFEVLVMKNKTSQKWSVSGQVLRTNLYGNQSHCVKKNKELKMYCYCLRA